MSKSWSQVVAGRGLSPIVNPVVVGFPTKGKLKWVSREVLKLRMRKYLYVACLIRG